METFQKNENEFLQFPKNEQHNFRRKETFLSCVVAMRDENYSKLGNKKKFFLPTQREMRNALGLFRQLSLENVQIMAIFIVCFYSTQSWIVQMMNIWWFLLLQRNYLSQNYYYKSLKQPLIQISVDDHDISIFINFFSLWITVKGSNNWFCNEISFIFCVFGETQRGGNVWHLKILPQIKKVLKEFAERWKRKFFTTIQADNLISN